LEAAANATSPELQALDAALSALKLDFAETRNPELQPRIAKLTAERRPMVQALLSAETRERTERLTAELKDLDREIEKLGKPQLVYAAANFFDPQGTFSFTPEPRPISVLQRGSVESPGNPVGPGALSCLPSLPSRFALDPGAPEGARRAALAHWITAAGNMLTWRSIVNRVWQYHFGRGLVDTPNDFGKNGSLPTHPELLDWLAGEFVRSGWSLKAMHRLVMLSSSYRMDSRPAPAAAERDPENRLVSHQNRRRLEAEAVRDALLAASGRLDLALGGSLLPTKDGEYVTNDQSAEAAQYGSTRRSLYLPVIRNAVYDLFSTFDYADPSMAIEQRASTTDPSQALLLLNSPLAVGESQACARSLPALDDRARLEELWQRAYQRPPREEERLRAQAFLADHLAHDSGGDARARAWESLCRALCASNEFLYVD
jgi:hypothetical protein